MKVKTTTLPFWALAATSLSSAEGRTNTGVLGHRGGAERLHLPATFDLMTELLRSPVGWDRLFDEQDGRSLASPTSSPQYIIRDNENDMLLEVEVPGVSAEELNVEVEDRQLLRINGAHRRVGVSENLKFDLAFELAKNVDAEQMKVTLSNGILQVTVPKREPVIRKLEVVPAQSAHVNNPLGTHSSEGNNDLVVNVDGMEITTED